MEKEQQTEKDFQKYVHQHKVPVFIGMVWTILFIWGIYYLITWSIPNLKVGLANQWMISV